MEVEVWKDILNFEGYQVSNLGNVKSNITNTILIGGVKKSGYRCVILRKNNKSNYKLVHRLVAEVFIPNPQNKPQVNHIDGNKLNNNINNLEWCTKSENQIHAFKIGLQKRIAPKDNPSSKPIKQYNLKGELIKEYDSINQASRITKLNLRDISKCCLRKRKQLGGYIWRYKQDGFI